MRLPADTEGTQRLDHLAVVRLGEERGDMLRDHRADVRDLLQRLDIGFAQRR